MTLTSKLWALTLALALLAVSVVAFAKPAHAAAGTMQQCSGSNHNVVGLTLDYYDFRPSPYSTTAARRIDKVQFKNCNTAYSIKSGTAKVIVQLKNRVSGQWVTVFDSGSVTYGDYDICSTCTYNAAKAWAKASFKASGDTVWQSGQSYAINVSSP